MVFGNKSSDSGSGFCFSRSPLTGERGLVGEFVFNAEGEDAVRGRRRTMTLQELGEHEPQVLHLSLQGCCFMEYSDDMIF